MSLQSVYGSLSKWRTFFKTFQIDSSPDYQNGELFSSYQNGEYFSIKMANFFKFIKMANFCVIKKANFFYQNGELFFIKMANFFLRLFSKWRIFRRSHEMSQRFDSKKQTFCSNSKQQTFAFQKSTLFSKKYIFWTCCSS